ncbi:transcription factor IIA, alpha/beta subunit [Dunaliella salina]|uniref:Transcription factor IIA, alpha/beta subunit n=1 Tax=Dunaliella salina TaxID=3046 RepID=A0ABQ7H2S0_DUNSA|nr:transcription factor IIA, alpha/beta subunit [Dunaliella salina]|eukprot:KAF5841154.1 transcription factor IIA, alpha/beta subunit [Dunaliella salina]
MNTSSVYKWVIDDVVSKMKPETVQEGVDESVLDELRTLWQDKLTKKGLIRDEGMQAGFMARGGGLPLPQLGQGPPAMNTPAGMQQLMMRMLQMQQMQQQGGQQQPGVGLPYALPGAQYAPQLANLFAQQQQQQQPQAAFHGSKREAPEGGFQTSRGEPSTSRRPRVGPQGGLVPQQDGPADTEPTPSHIASPHQRRVPAHTAPTPSNHPHTPQCRIPQQDGPADEGACGGEGSSGAQRVIPQQDGPTDDGGGGGEGSSEAGTSGAGRQQEAAEGQTEDKGEAPADDEALSSDSGEDSSDEEADVDHFMCCQFEKVNRTKNRWKIAMKEGVFHVHGRDYLFKKAQGEWTF